MPRRDEDKKRRQQKRRQKKWRQKGQVKPSDSSPLASLDEIIRNLDRQLAVPEPSCWPGGVDSSLARPDLVKLECAEVGLQHPPGREKCKQLERGFQKGLLGFLPKMDDWSWEEFLYHGLPGDTWHPIEAFLTQAGPRFPPAAAAQIRRWQEAQIGIFEIGEVREDTVVLQEWDAVGQKAKGSPFRAITLNIGGVNIQRQQKGNLLLTYLAPWAPEQNLFCGMGYGTSFPKDHALFMVFYLGLRHPEIVSRVLPWNQGGSSLDQHMSQWRRREWYSWLQSRLVFPFLGLMPVPPKGMPEVKEVTGLRPSTPEEAFQMGIYLTVPGSDAGYLLAGATQVTPLEITSPNHFPLAEYQAYRRQEGPPPGTRGRAPFWTI